MKTFKKLFSEVAQPKAGEEKAFKDQHTIQKFDYPVQGSDAIFKGTVERKPRLADQDGDANHDKAYAQTSGDITLTGTQRESAELDEDAEQIDEISKDMAGRYIKKAMPQYKRAQDKQHVGPFGSATQKGADANKERLRKRHKGIGSVHKRYGGNDLTDRNPARNSMTGKKAPYQYESVELEEGSYERAAYGKGDAYDRAEAHADAARHHYDQAEKHEKARNFDAADLHMAAAKAHDKAEMRMSSIHSKQERGKNITLSSNLSKSRDAHAASVKANSHNESAEQIDEISKDMAQRYYSKSYDAQKKSMNTMIDTEKARKPEKKKAYDDARETLRKRLKGSDMAAKRLAYKGKNEEAEQIDEISKDLAGRYIKKAQVDTAHAGDQIATGSMGQMGASPDVKKGYEKQRQKGIAKLVRRRIGTADAVRKLTGKARVPATESYDDSPASPDEASMAKKQAEFIQYVAREIGMHIDNGKEFPEWMQNKLSALHQSAKDYHSHLGAHGTNEEVELEEKKLTAKQMKQALAGLKVKGKETVTLKKAPWEKDKNEALVGGQKKLDHNKNGKIDAHDFKMMRAKKKNEEVEQVDETTLSATKKMVNVTGPDGKVHTVQKRTKAKRTDDKGQDVIATRESIDEAYKQGSIKLKDGKTVKLSNEDADKLNGMMKGLNSSNRRKMEQTMMQSQKGFNEILSFAKTVS